MGEGLGNKFLSHIREVDAICEVVRCFENKEITHVEGSVDPIRDVEIINLELSLADLEIINNRIDMMDVDKLGLDHNDRTILLTLIEKFSGGPAGLDTLAASIGEDPGTIEDVYEPYLLKNGLINRTPRGRMVTELAYEHLGMKYLV